MTVSSCYANVLYNIPNSEEWLSKSSSFICYRESVFKIPNNVKESIEYMSNHGQQISFKAR